MKRSPECDNLACYLKDYDISMHHLNYNDIDYFNCLMCIKLMNEILDSINKNENVEETILKLHILRKKCKSDSDLLIIFKIFKKRKEIKNFLLANKENQLNDLFKVKNRI